MGGKLNPKLTIENLFLHFEAVHKTFHNLLLILNMFDLVRFELLRQNFGNNSFDLVREDNFSLGKKTI